ncbi:MAG: hypothetical protein H3C47_04195 [Candidatus Cloacimonetes bacterium]|nr:hypothetical protein [Candidatus Cloacimonadota bacterium]
MIHLEFNEALHGVAITRQAAYISYSSGKEWKEVLSGGDFRNMTYFSDLRYLWVTDDNGTVYFSSDSGLSWQTVTTTIGNTDTLTFKMRMESPTNGHFAYRDSGSGTLYLANTTDNWANYVKVGSIISAVSYARSSLSSYGQMVASDGVSHSLNHATSLFVTRAAPTMSGGQIILDTNLINDDLRVSLFRVGNHGNDLYLQFATETGVPATVNHELFSLNDETSAHREQSLVFRPDSTHFWLKQGHRIYRSTDSGLSFTAMKATTLNFPIWTAAFFDELNGFATLENGTILYTTDGALNWNSAVTVLPLVAERMIFARSATRGYLVEPADRIIRSSTADNFGTAVNHTVPAAAGLIRFAKLSGQDLIWSGDNGYYGRVDATPTALLETQLPAGYQINISAISSDGNGGYFMGGTAGQLFHLKSGETTPTDLGSAYLGSASPVRDICSVDNEVFLVTGLGQDTKISWDGGRTFRKLLASEYDSTLFTSCYLGNDGSLALAGPGNPGFFLRIGTGLDADRFANNILTDAQIDSGFVGDQIIPGSLFGEKLADLSVDGNKIVSRSILVSKIASHSVDSNKIQASTLTNRIFQDYSITNPKIGTDISGSKIGDNIILGVDFANVSISSNLIKTNSLYSGALSQTNALALKDEDFAAQNILTQHLRNQTLAGSRLTASTLREQNFADQSFTSSVFTTNTIEPDKVAGNTFSAKQILANQLEATHFSATGAITSSVLAPQEFWQDQIPDNAIQSSSLEDFSFDSSHLKSRIVSGSIIADNSIDWVAMMTASIEITQIVSDSIQGIDFAPGTITLAQIADGVINETIIQDYSIEAFQIKTADITSSKIAAQSVSGSHSFLTTLTANVLRNLEYPGTKMQPGVITNSKLAQLTLTSSNFKDLTEASMATASFGTTDAILFQPRVTGNNLDILWSNGPSNYETLGLSVGNSPLISHARFSHDGSKVAFALLEDGIWKLAYSDRNFSSIRRLSVTSNQDLQAGFQWDKNGRDFYYKVKASGDVYRFNTETQQSSWVTGVGGDTGIIKIVFSEGALDGFQNQYIYHYGMNAYHSAVACDPHAVSLVTDITMTPNGRYVANYQGAIETLRICDTSNGNLVYNSSFPVSALLYHPTDNQHLWFINTSNRLSYVPVPSMSPTSQVLSVFEAAQNSRSFLHPSHILTENTIVAANVPSKILTSGKLANLSFGPESFASSMVITAGHLQDLSIQNQHIALANLSNSEIQSGSLTIGHISSLALAGEHFLSGSVLTQHLNAESIQNRHLQTSQVLNAHFAANSVISGKLADQSIVTTHILDGSVNSEAMIVAAVIDGSKIKTGIVSSGHIFDLSIGSAHIETTTLNASRFQNDTIPNAALGSRILTSGHFATNFIDGNRLQAGAIAPLPGFLLTIEGNSLYSYDPDFSSKELVPVPAQNWREIRRTAHGNRFVLTNDSLNTYQVNLVSGELSLASTVPSQTYQVRNRFEGVYYHMDAGNLVTKTDQNVFVSQISGIDTVGFDFDPGSNELIFIKNSNELHNTQGQIASLGFTLSNPRAGYDSRILVILNSNEVYSYKGGWTQLYAAGADTIVSLSPSLSSEVFYIIKNSGANQQIIRLYGDGGLQTGELLGTLAPGTVSRLELIDYSAIAHLGITQLDNASVTSEKIAARSFGPENFAVGAVKTANILDLGLTSRVFINESVTNAKFGGSIVAEKIQNESLLSEHIQNGSINNAHVADGSFLTRHFQTHVLSATRLEAAEVPIGKFFDNSIGENSFADNTIPNARFADSAISAPHIADGAITNTKVSDGTIIANRIASNSITKDSFATGAVTSDKIQNSVITSSQISTGSLTDTALSIGALTNSEISNNGINDSSYLKDYSFTGDRFLGSIQTNQLSTLDTDAFSNTTITNADFSASGFGTTHLQTGTLTTAQFVAPTLSASKFASGSVTLGHINPASLLLDAKFNTGAFTLAKIKNQTVSGASVFNSDLALAKMGSFGGESFDASITNAKLAGGGNFVLKTAHFGTTDLLTLSDFTTLVVNGDNTATGSIGNAELAQSAIVKTAPGLLASNDLITDSLIANNSLEAINFAEGSIPGTRVAPAFSGDKLADSSVYTQQLGNDLNGAKFVNQSFLNVHIQNQIIPATVFTGASIGIGNIGAISSSEFAQESLDNSSVADTSLVTADLGEKLRSSGMVNLKPIHFQDGVFLASNVGKIITKNSIDTTDPLTENRFLFSPLSSDNALHSGVAAQSVTMGLLNTSTGNFQSLFTGSQSTLHSHNVLLQPISCPSGYTAVTNSSKNGNSFCISSEQPSNSFSTQRTNAKNITLSGIGSMVSGQVCSLEQLIAARKQSISINDAAMSSTLSLEASGYSGTVNYLNLGTFNPGTGSGSFSQAQLSVNSVAHYCL